MESKKILLAEISASWSEALKKHKGGDIPVQYLRELAVESPSLDVRIFLASYSDTPSRILENLFDADESIEVLSALADNPRTPKVVLQHLARHENTDVRMAVATSRAISPQTALILCDDENPFIRAALAANSMVTSRIQVRLSEDPVPFVRVSLLSSPRLDEEVFSALAEDMDPVVQAACLTATKAPADTLLQWADSDEEFPQSILLQRKSLPDNVLESLCFSSHSEIQKAAVEQKRLTLDEMLGFAAGEDEALRLKIASMPDLPELVQQVISEDKSRDVLIALSRCPVLTGGVALKLAQSGYPEVVSGVAANLNVPDEALRELALRGGIETLKLLTMRRCSQNVLDIIYESGNDDLLYHLAYNYVIRGMGDVGIIPPKLVTRLAVHELPTLRCLAAASHDLPVLIMAQLARDASVQVRLCLSRNPNVCTSVMELLAGDGDGHVRTTAKGVLARRALLPPQETEEPAISEVPADEYEAEAQEEAPVEETSRPSFLSRILRRMTGGDETE